MKYALLIAKIITVCFILFLCSDPLYYVYHAVRYNDYVNIYKLWCMMYGDKFAHNMFTYGIPALLVLISLQLASLNQAAK